MTTHQRIGIVVPAQLRLRGSPSARRGREAHRSVVRGRASAPLRRVSLPWANPVGWSQMKAVADERPDAHQSAALGGHVRVEDVPASMKQVVPLPDHLQGREQTAKSSSSSLTVL